MQPKMAVGWRANILLVGREFRFYRTRGEERAPEFFAVIYEGGGGRARHGYAHMHLRVCFY